MALLPIIKAPDPRLKVKCATVEAVTPEIVQLMDDMLETMYDAPGVGLAAPQVGVTQRILVVDVAREGEERQPLCMANPEVIWESDEERAYEEGCLSLPEQYDEVIRPAQVKVRYLGRDNQTHEIEADGLLSVAIQHEMDHLDGILFVDHLSSLKRNMILRKMTKLKKLEQKRAS